MFIYNKEYKTPMLNDITCIRNLLYTNFYGDPAVIENIKNIIRSVFNNCEDITFDKNRCSFTIVMDHSINTEDICAFLYNIFIKFVKENEARMIDCLKISFNDPYAMLNTIYNNNSFFAVYELMRLNDKTILIRL